MDPQFVEAAAITCNTPVVNRIPEQRGVFYQHHHSIRDVQPLHFSVGVDTPKDIHHWIGEWSQNPIGMLRAIHKEDQGHLNKDDLDVWLWCRGIIPKTHDGLFEKLIWCDIFLTPGRFITLTGNPERLTPLLAQLRDCPMSRHWAWLDNTTPNVVPLECIACWLWTSAGITADRAQCNSVGWSPTPNASNWGSGTAKPPWKHRPGQRPNRRDLVRSRQGGELEPLCPDPLPHSQAWHPFWVPLHPRWCPTWASEPSPNMMMSSWKTP